MESINKEIWEDVKGYEGLYKISSYGRVKRDNCIIHPNRNTYGYLHVSLCKDGIVKTKPIHIMVGEVFIKNDKNYKQINHKDGNKENNKIENLEWCSQKQNNIHAIKTGLKKTHNISMYKDNVKIKTFYNRMDIKEFFKDKKICQDLITRVCNGVRKTAYGYVWKYE